MLYDLTCQDYRDSTLQEALAAGCDAVQPKYDGWWCHAAWRENLLELRSKTMRHFDTRTTGAAFAADIICEAMVGTQWSQDPTRKGRLFVFDLWGVMNEDLRDLPYRRRMQRLADIARQIPETFRLFTPVPTFPIARRDELWKMVESGLFEGVVYRKLNATVDEVVLREKLLITRTLKAVRVIPAEPGKFEGMMGAVVGVNSSGVEIAVGGGWSTSMRVSIMQNPDSYLGRYFDVEARAEFESGSLRHPNFVTWRDDL